ncbi:DUF4031 domain-containing protein [Kribbia dieselivorans]|uniref:DUF4031 domain-containing protein n=1 Tax=Kribbia dieselivorans TaxID=331526 RepID=UPI000838700C|nr:DUF4031 domain-containing protein [Kribbia dieselivorans]
MAVLIDPPQWPARGTLFSHLVSDASLEELHEFADRLGAHPRAFDQDHYDIPQELHSPAVALGALAVSGTELVRRLIASGLRLSGAARRAQTTTRVSTLRQHWATVLPQAPAVGEELLERWGDRSRRYHDQRHLLEVLEALGSAQVAHPSRALRLAAWFHDAIYEGRPGQDESDSAELAIVALSAHVPVAEIDEVTRLVLLTAGHHVEHSDHDGIALCDADLAILGADPGRYDAYARDVRAEYSEVPVDLFRQGRALVLDDFLTRERLYVGDVAHAKWDSPARANLSREVHRLRSG